MSRSYRKTPIFGHTKAESEKEDKKLWHRAWRRSNDIESSHREFSNPWDMSKDGKTYWKDAKKKDMRK